MYIKPTKEKKRRVETSIENKEVVPISFRGTLTTPKKKRPAMGNIKLFYSGAQNNDDVDLEGKYIQPEDENDQDFESQKSETISLDSDQMSIASSVASTMQISVPRMFAKNENENVSFRVMRQKEQKVNNVPQKKDFLDFVITDIIGKVQGKEDSILGKVLILYSSLFISFFFSRIYIINN